MYKDSFDFIYNAEGDYYDLVVDKKIQKVVEELKALPHDVLIRYLTYWSEAIDSRKYVVESDLPHEEWYTDCCDYAASETDEERYMHAKCMTDTLGHMLQDIKNNYPNKYPAAMRTVKSWKNYSFIGFTPTMREEIDKAWDTMLHPMTAEELVEKRNTWEEEVKQFEEEKKQYIIFFRPEIKIDYIGCRIQLADYKEPANLRVTCVTKNNYQVYYRRNWLDKWESLGSYAKIYPQAYGIRVVQNREGKYLVRTDLYKPMEKPEQTYEFAELQDNALLHFTEQGKEYWVYLENMTCLTRKPEFVTIGFLDFLKIGGVYMRRGRNNGETYRRAEIRMYDDICFLGSREVFVKTAYRKYHYYIQQRSLDGKHFVLSDSMKPKESSTWFDMYYDGKNPPIVERRKKDYEIYGVKK